ncbi:lipid II:glycine glycyltransferase FemX [Pelagicoccus mobilis]|uniref:GNAT family N-acetyltransferase n=1 Tax=Pelagicoccus mobilis TaxID=415221 RepID=A0A934VQ81_9BACT|nr:GNAT family N-acetyltransferase [Pelagicoccus mobilis]MBK1876620.1 GNAT family N-acetyltransferase [Pelagicoccus mobilis]
MSSDATNARSPHLGSQTDCRVTSPADEQLWGDAIASIDESSRFLCQDWQDLLEKTYGYQKRLVILQRSGKIEAVMPFMIVKSLLTGTRAISLPFFDICRAYAPNEQDVPHLYEALRAEGQLQGWDYIELRGDIRKLNIETPSLSFYNHVVDLSGGPDKVFASMASSARRAIRKAEKSGVRIEFSSSPAALKGFYALQSITRRRHGLPPQPYCFFENLRQALIEKGRGTIVSAFVGDELAASSIYLEQGENVHYKYGASDTRFQETRCNNYVMWQAMKHYAERNFQSMDLGRNSLNNAGLRKYKNTWGSKERLTYYHRYDLKQEKAIPMSDDVYGWHNKVFSKLPRPLAQLAGTILYKHIA